MNFMQYELARSIHQDRLREAEQERRWRELRRAKGGRKAKSHAGRNWAVGSPWATCSGDPCEVALP
nr:hypothetical protein GCM10025730_21730 [Promicromonospora thailandica]